MADVTRSDQRGSTVFGDQAGRDINKFYGDIKNPAMKKLAEKYKHEIENNKDFADFISALQHFLDKYPGDILNLNLKLTKAGFNPSQIMEAERLKELAYKKVMLHRYKESAQQIFAFVFGHLYVLFQKSITPMITNGAPLSELQPAFYEKVIEPAFSVLDENVLTITYQELIGMVHFLTGNCHLKWHDT